MRDLLSILPLYSVLHEAELWTVMLTCCFPFVYIHERPYWEIRRWEEIKVKIVIALAPSLLEGNRLVASLWLFSKPFRASFPQIQVTIPSHCSFIPKGCCSSPFASSDTHHSWSVSLNSTHNIVMVNYPLWVCVLCLHQYLNVLVMTCAILGTLWEKVLI